MTFAEFYKNSKRGFLREDELPNDVKDDLMAHLAQNDGTIGVYVYHSHELNVETNTVEFKGMKMGYYLRTWKPLLKLEIRNWFWRHTPTRGNV